MEVTRRRGRRRRKLLDDLKDRIRSFEGRSSRSHYVEELFWRRLWTCRQTEYWMNEWRNVQFDTNFFYPALKIHVYIIMQATDFDLFTLSLFQVCLHEYLKEFCSFKTYRILKIGDSELVVNTEVKFVF